jgi:hypothetical protein
MIRRCAVLLRRAFVRGARGVYPMSREVKDEKRSKEQQAAKKDDGMGRRRR